MRKIFLPIFMVLTVVGSLFSNLITTSESISDKVFRLHILAHSDTSYDQTVKLQLRDYILTQTAALFTADNIEDSVRIAQEHIGEINSLCNEFLNENGYPYHAVAEVTREYFKTRVYDDFTLPAGEYQSLKITLGAGEGHNWWCIIFPSVCLASCSESMSEYLTDEEMQILQSGYTPKFKMIEIYEKIKSRTD